MRALGYDFFERSNFIFLIDLPISTFGESSRTETDISVLEENLHVMD